MRLLFFLVNLLIPSSFVLASQLQKVDLRLCGVDSKKCLLLSAPEAEVSQTHSSLSFSNPRVNGLGLGDKMISSAIVDFTTGRIFLRERVRTVYVGEWVVSLDNLDIRFFPKPK